MDAPVNYPRMNVFLFQAEDGIRYYKVTEFRRVLFRSLDVLLLLVGMMVLVAGLDVCGFFDLVSSRIALRAKSQVWFLAWLMIATAALSALVLNDTIALLVTPVVVRSARALRVNPVPYLVAV